MILEYRIINQKSPNRSPMSTSSSSTFSSTFSSFFSSYLTGADEVLTTAAPLDAPPPIVANFDYPDNITSCNYFPSNA